MYQVGGSQELYKMEDFYFYLFIFTFIFERGTEHKVRRGRGRGRHSLKQAPSSLWAVCTEPDVGLEPTNCEIMNWTKGIHSTNWATQASKMENFYMKEGGVSTLLAKEKDYYGQGCFLLGRGERVLSCRWRILLLGMERASVADYFIIHQCYWNYFWGR